MNFIKRTYFLFILLGALSIQSSYASHIRAGEIVTERTSNTTFAYRFTLVLYTSNDGPSISQTARLLASDGWDSGAVPYTDAVNVGNDVVRMTFIFNHTFASAGSYRVTFRDVARVSGILNMTASGSMAFFIETFLVIDPFIGINNTPNLLVPPIDYGATGQVYNYNPGAYDQDGDSLSYELTTPLQDDGLVVNNFRNPGTAEFSAGNISLTLDPVTGNLVWDYPNVAGLYNIAYRIKEYRGGRLISYTHRDMQIEIINTTNIKPELQFPESACYVAGEEINEIITATDANDDGIEITAYGGVIGTGSNDASFTQTSTNPASGIFIWTPACSHVRSQPYQIVFKADDSPSKDPSLVDIETWEIQVYGPSPQNLTSTRNVTNNTITLNWSAYTCSNISSMSIWRKKCSDSTAIECDDDLANYGYERIALVTASTTTFVDNNAENGVNYCYRLVADFNPPSGGKSIPSDETCQFVGVDFPLMLNVSVVETDKELGKIFVRWRNKISDSSAVPKYRLFRGEGQQPTTYTEVMHPFFGADTFYTDSLLNTTEKQYAYYARILSDTDSDPASSIWLSGETETQRITLKWQAKVPWSITSGLPHYIYRKYENQGDVDFRLIDSVVVFNKAEMIYVDTGQTNSTPLVDGDTVCYYVVTQGTYCNKNINNYEILLNNSQRICVVPDDIAPPCPPILSVNSDCEVNIENLVTWIPVVEPAPCDDDIDFYELEYKSEIEGTFAKLITTKDTAFLHNEIEFVSGCYRVRAVDKVGNIGAYSDSVCVDDCPRLEFPNVFSPNNDTENQFFNPIPPVRAVKNINLTIYNRWGKKVYTYEGDENINWSGQNLSDGLYFYKVDVEFYRLNEEDRMQNLKGWFEIIR